MTVTGVYLRDDPNFLQGIEYLGSSRFIENGGWYGESRTLITELDGDHVKVVSSVPMDKNYFGEGICSLPSEGQFIRMTW